MKTEADSKLTVATYELKQLKEKLHEVESQLAFSSRNKNSADKLKEELEKMYHRLNGLSKELDNSAILSGGSGCNPTVSNLAEKFKTMIDEETTLLDEISGRKHRRQMEAVINRGTRLGL